MSADEGGKSIGWVVAMLMLAIAGFGWAFAAADYFQNSGDGGAGRANFFVNAFTQIPNMPAVLGFTFRNRIWLPIVVVILEIAALGFGVVMKRVEADVYGGGKRRK